MFRGIALVDTLTGLFTSQKLKGIDGSAQIIGGALALGPVYTDGTYNYYGEAAPGSALTDPVWRVSRETISTSRIQWADGNDKTDNVFTDLATVAAMNFI